MLRKMSAFGDQSEIERAKKRLAMEEQAQLTIAPRPLTIASKYFVNYNKVEAVFLGCAIYVCLAGVMFSSGYFDNPLFTWQRTFLGIFTAIVGGDVDWVLPLRRGARDHGRAQVPQAKEQG